jgi:hypothetical protein
VTFHPASVNLGGARFGSGLPSPGRIVVHGPGVGVEPAVVLDKGLVAGLVLADGRRAGQRGRRRDSCHRR